MFKQLLFLALAVFFFSCDKQETDGEIAQRNETQIVNYLETNNLKSKATRTASGLYYIITDSTNTGLAASKGRKISVIYKGKFLDNSIFDSTAVNSTPFRFDLGYGQVIKGWDEGIAFLKEGQSARLFIPSHLGYGRLGSGRIPANTPLQFDIKIADIQ
jgi:peptidylprolyl isomerase